MKVYIPFTNREMTSVYWVNFWVMYGISSAIGQVLFCIGWLAWIA